MLGTKSRLRSSVAARGATALVMALAAAGCSSDVTRIAGFGGTSDPQYTGSIPSEPVGGDAGAYAATGSGSAYGGAGGAYGSDVQSAPLDRPAGQQSYGQAPSSGGSDGRTVVVGPGETLDTISRRFAVPRQALISVNGLSGAGDVRPGQQLLVPVYSASRGGWVAPQATQSAAASAAPASASQATPAASAAAASTVPVAQSQSGTTHRVQSGETIYSIGRAYGVSPGDIIAANSLADPNNLRAGSSLKIPGRSGTTQTAQTAKASTELQPKSLDQQARENTQQQAQAPAQPAAPSQAQTQTQSAQPAQQQNTQVAMAPAGQNVATDAGTGVASGSEGTFRWPVRGRVISAFGDKANGGKNDGINISVPVGTSVQAAEDGVVAYAGNELKGYGNLVLIRHKGDWVTAYAHNSEILVERGDTVSRGQVIAKAGQSGSVNAPQVHFEVRRNSTPVDPLKHLAGG